MRLSTTIAGMLLATTALAAIPPASVGADDIVTVVTGDENPTPTQVVASEPSSGWDIGRDPANLAPFEFVELGNAPIGDGALYVGPITNDIRPTVAKPGADKFITEYVLGIPAADFESISYDLLVDTATPAADANEFFLNIYTSLPAGDPNYDAFYNCRFDVVPTTASDIDFTAIALAATDAPSAVTSRSGATCPATISGMPVGSTLSFVSLNVGDTSLNDQGVAGYFDNVVIAAAGDTETFDFEAPPATPGGSFTATDVTEDENPTPEETAAFLPSSGWDIGRDPANLAPFEFTTDAASIGDGALYAGPIGNDIKTAPTLGADKFITEYVLDIPAAQFQSISYDILVDTATPAADANEFYLNVYANMPGSTSFYDCRWNVVPQTATNSGFTTVGISSGDTTANPGLSVTERNDAQCPVSLGAMPAGSTVSFISLSMGDTSTNDTDVAGYFDNVVIRSAGNIDVFDFEAPAPPPTGLDELRKVVEDEDDLFGWDIADGTGFETVFEFNDDVASIGAGALLVGPIGNDINGPADKFISSHIVGVPTSAFESISYDVLVGDVNDANEFYLNVYANMPGSRSFYECRFDVVPTPGDVSATDFSTIELTASDTPIVVPRDGATCPTTIGDMPAGSTISFVSLNVGDTSGSDQGVTGYLDNFVISVGGNTETFDFDIDEAPVFLTQPDDVDVDTAPGASEAVATFPTPAASDDLSIPVVECVPASGSTFPVGTTQVTCTATDSIGQTAETTFDVNVIAVPAIDTPPVFDDVPVDLVVQTAPGATDTVVDYDAPTASDDMGEPTVTCDPASGSTFPVGTTQVTCTATDSIGQTAETTFVVEVIATPAGQTPVSDLIAIDNARLLETRSGTGLVTIDGTSEGIGAAAAGDVIEVDIAGRGGVDGDAIGAVLNVASVSPEGAGFATLYPCTDDVPNAASLNMTAGVNISNTTFVDLTDDGAVCIFTSVGSDFALDVVGYLPASSRLGLVDPARLLETRTGPGLTTIDGRSEGDGPVAGGNTIEVKVAGRGGVDDDAVAAMVNVAAVRPADAGFITLFPCGTQPLAASLNYTTGINISNATLVELSDDGELCVFVEDTVDLTIDVVGFVPPGTDVGTVVPARLLETRSADGLVTVDNIAAGGGPVAAGTSIEVPIAGRGGIASDAASAVLNLAGVRPADRGFATLYPCTDEVPNAASLNMTAGVNISNATLVDLSDAGSVCLFSSVDADFVIDGVSFVNDPT